MQSIYLGAIAFGVTLLVVSLIAGGKDHDHGDHVHSHDGAGFAWAPFTSIRFWTFLFAFGGGAGYALSHMGTGAVVSGIGALVIGWAAGAMAVMVVRSMARNSVSSEVGASELIGQTGTLMLPVGPGKPGKVRVDVKGRAEDFVANNVDESGDLPTGATVLIVAEGDRGTLLVSKHDV